MSVTRKEDARARGTCLRASSRGQLRSPEMESLHSQATPIAFRYVRDTSAPQDDALLACLLALSSYLENIISDLLFEIFFIKLGRGGKAPPRLASQASLDLLGLFNTLSWKIGSFSHGDNSLRFLLQNFTSQSFYSWNL